MDKYRRDTDKKLGGDPASFFTVAGSGEAGQGTAGLMRAGISARESLAQGATIGAYFKISGERASRQVRILVDEGAVRQGLDGRLFWLWPLRDLAGLYGVLKLPSWRSLADRFRQPDGGRISSNSLRNNVPASPRDGSGRTFITDDLLDRLYLAGEGPED